MNAIDAALYARLSTDGTLTALLAVPPSGFTASVFNERAPESADMPYVVFNSQSEVDEYTLGSGRYGQDCLYTITAVAKGESKKLAGDIADEIDARLTLQTLTVSGKTVLVVRREQRFPQPEMAAGVQIHNERSIFRLEVQ